MKQTVKNRVLSACLALGMGVGLLPPLSIPANAAATVAYNQQKPEKVILPAQVKSDPTFLNSHVLTPDGYHIDDLFKLGSSAYTVNVTDSLSPLSKYKHSKNEAWKVTYVWQVKRSSPVIYSVRSQLAYYVSAKLTADKHSHAFSHGSKTDRAALRLKAYNESGSCQGVLLQNATNDPDEVAVSYMNFFSSPAFAWENMSLTASSSDCSCGSSAVSNTYVYLVDEEFPTVSSAYVSDGSGNKASKTAYKQGETAYLTLEMSEPVRFASNEAQNLTLSLRTKSAENNQSTDSSITARLTALTGNKLIFAYAVEGNQDVYVDEVSLSDQGWAYQKGGYSLSLTGGGRTYSTGLTTDSAVTDLAGNPLMWNGSIALQEKLCLDTVTPSIVRLNASTRQSSKYQVDENGNWPDISRDALYVNAGERVTFTVVFNEEIRRHLNGSSSDKTLAMYKPDVTATLNVVRANGEYVTLPAYSGRYDYDGVNSERVYTYLTFSGFVLTEDMTCEGPGGVLRIKSLSTSSGGYLCDPAGNEMKGTSLEISNEQTREKLLWDVTPPVVRFEKGANDLVPTKSGSAWYIDVPFTVEDTESGLAGGLADIKYTISHNSKFSLAAYVDDSENYSTNKFGAFRWGASVSGSNTLFTAENRVTRWLHIRYTNMDNAANIDPRTGSVSVTISVSATDAVGNTGTATLSGGYRMDTSGPSITISPKFTANMADKTLTTTVTVSDAASYLKTISVQWGTQPATSIDLSSKNTKSYTFTTQSPSMSDDSGELSLSITAVDAVNNPSETISQTYTYYFGRPVNSYVQDARSASKPAANASLTLSAPGRVGGSAGEKTMTTLAILGKDGLFNVYALESDGGSVNLFASNSLTSKGTVTGVAESAGKLTLSGWTPGGSDGFQPGEADGEYTVYLFTLATDKWTAALNSAGGEVSLDIVDTIVNSDDILTSQVDRVTVKASKADYQSSIDEPFQKESGEHCGDNLFFGNTDEAAPTTQTLRNIVFPVNISSGGAFAYQDIDFANSYLCLYPSNTSGTPDKTGSVYNREYLADVDSSSGPIQYDYSLDSDIPAGYYVLCLHLALQGDNHNDTGTALARDFVLTYQNNYKVICVSGAELTQDLRIRAVAKTDGETTVIGTAENVTDEIPSMILFPEDSYSPTKGVRLAFDGQYLEAKDEKTYYAEIRAWTENDAGDELDKVTLERHVSSNGYAHNLYLSLNDTASTLTIVSGRNEIHYQAFLGDGTPLEEHVFVIDIHSDSPHFDASVKADGNLGAYLILAPSTSYTAEQFALAGGEIQVKLNTLYPLQAPVTRYLDGKYRVYFSREELVEAVIYNAMCSTEASFTDAYGHTVTERVQFTDVLDLISPSVMYMSVTGGGYGYYEINAKVSPSGGNEGFNPSEIDWQNFGLSVDIGKTGTVDYIASIPMPEDAGKKDGEKREWSSTASQATGGFYRVSVQYDVSSKAYDINLYGAALTEDLSSVSGMQFQMFCCDELGNEYNTGDTGWSIETDSWYSTGKSDLYYNLGYDPDTNTVGVYDYCEYVPVIATSPEAEKKTDPDRLYLGNIYYFPIYAPNPTVKWQDPFGMWHDLPLEADPFQDALSVSLSPETPTNQDVTVTVTAAPGYTLTGLDAGEAGTDVTFDETGGTITLSQNGTVTMKVKGTSGTEKEKIFSTAVTNIDKTLEYVICRYDGNGRPIAKDAASAVGPVTVAVSCEEELFGVTKWQFPVGSTKNDSYTLSFSDQVGNTANVPVSPLCDVISGDSGGSTGTDTTPPNWEASLNVQAVGIWTQFNAYQSTASANSGISPENLVKDVAGQGGAYSLRLNFTAEDASPVKLIVKRGPSSGSVTFSDENDEIEGLTAAGFFLTWSGEEETPITIYLVDSAENKTSISLTLPAMDQTPPTGTIRYEVDKSNNAAATMETGPVKAYLDLDEENITVLDTANLRTEWGGNSGNTLFYYYLFTQNGSYTFRFRDTAGNIGEAEATVLSIQSDSGSSEMSVTGLKILTQGGSYNAWREDGGKTEWETEQENLHVSTSVTAAITTNMVIAGMTVAGDASGTFGDNRATVTFGENTTGTTSVTLAGKNGAQTVAEIPIISCIDKIPAPISSVTANGTTLTPDGNGVYALDAINHTKAEVRFTFDELVSNDKTAPWESDFATAGSSRLSQYHTYTFTGNGTTTFTFTDQAGNTTDVTVTVSGLDAGLTLWFSKKEDHADATTTPSALGTFAGNSTFYVKANRAVTVTVGDRADSVAADTWISCTTPADGGLLVVKAVDAANNAAYGYLKTELADTMPPAISFQTSRLYAEAGMAEGERDTFLKSDVSVFDNRDTAPALAVETGGVNWDIPGSYIVTYTATDAAGNTAAVARNLILTSAALPALFINGVPVQPYSILTLSPGVVTVTLGYTEEPLFLSIKSGYKTIAQMKNGAKTLLKNEIYSTPLSDNLTSPGYYTVRVRTQFRQEFLVYLYVQ